MKAIRQIIDEIKPTEPVVFFVSSRWANDGDRVRRIDISKDHQNVPKFCGEITNNMSLIELTMSCVEETFNRERGDYYIDIISTERNVRNKLHSFTLDTLASIMPQKQPRETKMYKWYRDKADSGIFSSDMYNALVHLYNYVQSNGKSEEVNKNTLSILTLLYNKNA